MSFTRLAVLLSWAAVASGLPGRPLCAAGPEFGRAEVALCGEPAPPASSSVCGFCVVARDDGPQVAFTTRPPACIVCVRRGEEVAVAVPVRGVTEPFSVTAEATLVAGEQAEVSLSLGGTVHPARFQLVRRSR